MIKRSPNGTDDRSTARQENPRLTQPRDARRVNSGGRKKGQCSGDLPPRGDRSKPVLPLANEVQGGWHRRDQGDEARPEVQRPWQGSLGERESATECRSLRSGDRASVAKKKRELGLDGDLRGRHLPLSTRTELLVAIEAAIAGGESLEAVCRVLELNPRAVYRWKSGKHESPRHGGGGGSNKITPLEEKRVLTLVRKFPQLRCRRISYELERKSLAFIGKTKVAEIMKAHGLNHAFVRGGKRVVEDPKDMLSHEPWRKNLLWGTDWTYLKIADRFWYLLIIVDWYSRKIVAWGLFPQITRFEVVAVVTEAVAAEKIDGLPKGAMKPRIVADHGSANIAQYTRTNIEVQGLDLWLSGVNRPTGNARTERTIGTLKWEEIHLEGFYESEERARTRLAAAIFDYNFRRPNAGNGGFAPNIVHVLGRAVLSERRKTARQETEVRRRKHWDQEKQAMPLGNPT